MMRRAPHDQMLGMTLIEVVIYAALLSFLIAGILNSLYANYERDARLLDDIEHAYDERT